MALCVSFSTCRDVGQREAAIGVLDSLLWFTELRLYSRHSRDALLETVDLSLDRPGFQSTWLSSMPP